MNYKLPSILEKYLKEFDASIQYTDENYDDYVDQYTDENYDDYVDTPYDDINTDDDDDRWHSDDYD